MTFPTELERLLQEATEGPSYLTDRWLFGEGKRKYPVASFQFYGSKQQDRELLLFLRNRADAILGLVRAAEGLSHGEDWNNGTHAKTHGYRRKLLEALAKLNGEDK